MKNVFMGFLHKETRLFDGFDRKNWVPSPLPPPSPPLPLLPFQRGHDWVKSETLRLFSNRPVIIRKSTLKSHENLLIVPKNSPRKAGYSRSIHMPAAHPFTVEDLHERITTEVTNNNHRVASAACVSLTHTMQHRPTDMSYTKIRDPAKSPASV